jgi:hypothetical protein
MPCDRPAVLDDLMRDASLLAAAARASGGVGGIDNDLKAVFRRVEENGRGLYVVGYELPEADGKFHEVKIDVTRRGLQVNAKRGYVAPESVAGETSIATPRR